MTKLIKTRITNNSTRAKAIPKRGGSITVPAGKFVDVDLPAFDKDRIAFWRGHGVIIVPVSEIAVDKPKPARTRGRARGKSKPDEQPAQSDLIGDGTQKRTDGPTVEEFVKAGYSAKNYPPDGYASKSTDDEIAAAIKAEDDAARQGGGADA
jgi:hypothetical protein